MYSSRTLLILQFTSGCDHNPRILLGPQPGNQRDHLPLGHGYAPGGRTFPVLVNEDRRTPARLSRRVVVHHGHVTVLRDLGEYLGVLSGATTVGRAHPGVVVARTRPCTPLVVAVGAAVFDLGALGFCLVSKGEGDAVLPHGRFAVSFAFARGGRQPPVSEPGAGEGVCAVPAFVVAEFPQFHGAGFGGAGRGVGDDELPATFGFDSVWETVCEHASGDGSVLELLAEFPVVADPRATGGVAVFAAFPVVVLPDPADRTPRGVGAGLR